jgi:tetrahydromethanopterin S-methyltransferase subunit B
MSMNSDPVDWAAGMLQGLVVAVICLAFMISVSRNLRALRKESARQSELLEEIARGLRPKEDAAPKRDSILYQALQPQKVSRGIIIGIAVLLVIILVAVALSSRH